MVSCIAPPCENSAIFSTSKPLALPITFEWYPKVIILAFAFIILGSSSFSCRNGLHTRPPYISMLFRYAYGGSSKTVSNFSPVHVLANSRASSLKSAGVSGSKSFLTSSIFKHVFPAKRLSVLPSHSDSTQRRIGLTEKVYLFNGHFM